MKITIHADPGAEGMAVAERVKAKIERRVAATEGITEVVQASDADTVSFHATPGETVHVRRIVPMEFDTEGNEAT